MLILAGVSISFLIGDNGVINKAQSAVNEYEGASKKEQDLLEQIDNYIESEIGEGSVVDDNINSEYNVEKGVNKPKLLEGMIPVKYNKTSGKWVITNEDDKEWYDYNNKQWANVMLSDGKYKTSNSGKYKTDGTTEVEIADLGSMFVWIPRYAYKITSGYHNDITGTINVQFLKGRTNENDANVNIVEYNEETTANYTKFPDGYVVHPAFTSNVDVGGWDKEIAGIWVSKFEAGYPMEGSIDSTAKTSRDMYYPVFKGQRYSYIKISIGDSYDLSQSMYNNGNPYEITSNLNSHMIKNSEWGAVAYLTQSKYGKNTEIYPNNVRANVEDGVTLTGYGASTANTNTSNLDIELGLTEEIGTSTVWYKEAGFEASTTGNITGVYDMSGGSWDYTASLIPSGHSNISIEGGEMAKVTNSTKYVTLYPIGGSTAEETDIKLSYPDWGRMFGDALWETSLKTNGSYAWNKDRSDSVSSTSGESPFIVRGGSWNMEEQTGSFCFASNNGIESTHSTFRVAFVIE